MLLVIGWYETPQAQVSSSGQLLLDTLSLTNCEVSLAKRLLCLKHGKYRTFDGTCNNLCNITTGATFTPHRRLLPDAYEPDFQPRQFSTFQAASGERFPLPNARQASKKVFDSVGAQADFTHLVMTWGQFLDHDLTLTEFTVGVDPQNDCGGSQDACPSLFDKPDCFGVNITSGNNLLSDPSAKCTPLSRSERDDNGNQVNEITSYLDSSNVYGSDLENANSLRKFTGGELLVEAFPDIYQLPVLPAAESAGGEAGFCRSENVTAEPCFRAGDPRVNENQALMAMHALWAREHNRIVNILHLLNPWYDDEKLYQEGRRIVGACMQHITYNEWLPTLIPSLALRKEAGVALEAPGTLFGGYDPFTKASMFNVFSTAALRIGHTLIRETFTLADGVRGGNRLNESVVTFFDPAVLYELELGVNPYTGIYLGLALERALDFDRNIALAVLENLIIPGPGDGFRGDLAAINMQRGRDHGLPGYIQFSTLCGGPAATGTNFNDLTDIPFAQRIRLEGTYRTVEDIDIFAGILSENILAGSALGRTATCLLLTQFNNTRRGDRFWYENDDPLTGFPIKQLDEIRNCNLARVICDNSDGVFTIQPKVFMRRLRDTPNDDVSCSDLPYVDLEVFKESPKYYGAPKLSRSGGFGGNVAA